MCRKHNGLELINNLEENLKTLNELEEKQEVNINATGPWPLDDLHLQYINITFFIIVCEADL